MAVSFGVSPGGILLIMVAWKVRRLKSLSVLGAAVLFSSRI